MFLCLLPKLSGPSLGVTLLLLLQNVMQYCTVVFHFSQFPQTFLSHTQTLASVLEYVVSLGKTLCSLKGRCHDISVTLQKLKMLCINVSPQRMTTYDNEVDLIIWILIHAFLPPLNSFVPSGENMTWVTPPCCPWSKKIIWPSESEYTPTGEKMETKISIYQAMGHLQPARASGFCVSCFRSFVIKLPSCSHTLAATGI